jgi:hypothetical protein
VAAMMVMMPVMVAMFAPALIAGILKPAVVRAWSSIRLCPQTGTQKERHRQGENPVFYAHRPASMLFMQTRLKPKSSGIV